MNQLDGILFQVGKPARYTGGEWNSVVKDWHNRHPFRPQLSRPL
jgi:hypothetical protein